MLIREEGASSSYLCSFTDDLMIVHVVAGHWRDTAAKQALYAAMADKLAVSPGLRREDVQVIITSNDLPDWSFGNGLASHVSAEAAQPR